MWPIATDVVWSVLICWSRAWTVPTRLNWSSRWQLYRATVLPVTPVLGWHASVCLSVCDMHIKQQSGVWMCVCVSYRRQQLGRWQPYRVRVLPVTPASARCYAHAVLTETRRREPRQTWAPAPIRNTTSGGLPIRQTRQLPKARHGALWIFCNT